MLGQRNDMHLAAFWRRTYRDILMAAAVLSAAAVPRMIGLDAFLTADEKNWIGRSHEFIQAFVDGRFNDMLQTTHPGVTILWLTGGAIALKTWTDGLPFSFAVLEHFVRLPQFIMAAANTVLIVVIYGVLIRLLPRRTAFLAALLLAMDPLLVGYGRVVHVDALLSHLLFLAALLVLQYARQDFSRKWLLLSAVAATLALLTKAPAVFVLPWFGLTVLVFGRGRWRTRPFVLARTADAVQWLVIIIGLAILLWPALLWVPNPKGNALLLKRDISQAALQPHDGNEEYEVNPLFYLETLLIRVSPAVQVLAVTAVAAAVFAARSLDRRQRMLARWLAAYVFFFVLMMTLGAKKGDRYILPVFPALDVLAAIGFFAAVRLAVSKRSSVSEDWKRLAAAGGGVVLVGSLAVTVWRYHPYALSYTHPWFPDNLSQERGWGEGLEQVGAWLNEHDPQAVVASWYPEELGTFTTARVSHINAHEQHQVRYVVLYRNMFGRPPEHYANNFIDEYFVKREPVFTARVAGEPFAWVYKKPVFEHIVGELVSGVTVGQVITSRSLPLAGIDLLPATYSGTAKRGELVVYLRKAVDGAVVQEWRVPVENIEDNHWLTLRLQSPLVLTNGFVEITADGTVAGDAPTLRYGRQSIRPGDFTLNGVPKQGDLAIRLRYMVDGQDVTEEDTKLLPEVLAR
ncbi:MAG: hypothetical protein COT71_03005 [Candidatus Andersenbacteria bacterium CG10_big_fil_rev_8_21_14_0_10_54_11]|uniref:Glycosyltransferase RgtA/B/C/D-like domain-containing protein n=1 Tax=Candidatus Andersenbacteria bacterium CG10_big_fil_rev_8_21_14_0_10_54_11 TaxID=1974485 RepID=A0A2M6WZ23_9BACT|nr:MAG: hypothetical protein COT71_03005 [Candidatus Andersenbacteria bacterium CG10_big_fil_rev_8_21_14_0_10_54_11]